MSTSKCKNFLMIVGAVSLTVITVKVVTELIAKNSKNLPRPLDDNDGGFLDEGYWDSNKGEGEKDDFSAGKPDAQKIFVGPDESDFFAPESEIKNDEGLEPDHNTVSHPVYRLQSTPQRQGNGTTSSNSSVSPTDYLNEILQSYMGPKKT